jgi:hypothetical protein
MTLTRYLFLAFLVVAGCSRGDGLATVRGSVTCDGQPVAQGSIQFTPVDGNAPTAAIPIQDGNYDLRVAPTKMRVEIHGYKKVGMKSLTANDPKSPQVDDLREYIPEKYNAQSELTADIHSGENKLDFPLHGAIQVDGKSRP